MTRTGSVSIALALLLLSLVQAAAHEREALFTRNEPVTVVVRYKEIVHVKLWEQVLNVNTTIPESSLDIKIDDNFPNTVVLTNKDKKTTGLIYATTASGVIVNMRILHWGEPNQVVTVKDARTEAQRAVQRENEKSKLTPEERAVRQLWRAQWGFPTDPLVHVEEMNIILDATPEREVRLIKRYETVGFHGFTQIVRNVSGGVINLHPATVTFDCPLFSVALDGHQPPLSATDDPHLILPSGSVLVHLTCKGARSAKVR